jgi:beta-lysine 5,6-aminomutase beta subunit
MEFPSVVKPYGDTLDDGQVQVSFTLPVPDSPESREGAKILLQKMGLKEPKVVHAQDIGGGFSYFILYGSLSHTVDLSTISVPRVDVDVMNKAEINLYIKKYIRRKVCVVGACIETDAHTVGIDAIMNMKGYNGHKGLESYKEIDAYNLGSQVSCEELVTKARELKADAILVSQVVTQKDIHITNLTRLTEMLEAENMRSNIILVVGGPRVDHKLAQELGYDAGFGPGTYAEDVASFVVRKIKEQVKG